MVAIASLPTPAREFCQDLQTENARLRRLLELKDEQIKLLNWRLFGPKHEQLSSAQMALLLTEVSVSSGEVEQIRTRIRNLDALVPNTSNLGTAALAAEAIGYASAVAGYKLLLFHP